MGVLKLWLAGPPPSEAACMDKQMRNSHALMGSLLSACYVCIPGRYLQTFPATGKTGSIPILQMRKQNPREVKASALQRERGEKLEF